VSRRAGDMEETLQHYTAFLASPAGLVFLARRIRIGARALVEQERLEAWLETHALCSPSAYV
jgi:hypothetical protein